MKSVKIQSSIGPFVWYYIRKEDSFRIPNRLSGCFVNNNNYKNYRVNSKTHSLYTYAFNDSTRIFWSVNGFYKALDVFKSKNLPFKES